MQISNDFAIENIKLHWIRHAYDIPQMYTVSVIRQTSHNYTTFHSHVFLWSFVEQIKEKPNFTEQLVVNYIVTMSQTLMWRTFILYQKQKKCNVF